MSDMSWNAATDGMEMQGLAAGGASSESLQPRADVVVSQSSDAEAPLSTQQLAGTKFLPFELLVEILSLLSTLDVMRAARVCKLWRAATEKPGVWRRIGFSQTKGNNQIHTFKQNLPALVAKTGNHVVSVDFACLSEDEIQSLCACLMHSTHSLRFILWSKGKGYYRALREVCQLAKLCPLLETLELRSSVSALSYSNSSNIFGSEAPAVYGPRNISITTCGYIEWISKLVILDHATALAFKGYDEEASLVRNSMDVPTSFLAQLFQRNPHIEQLTAHGVEPDYRDELSGPATEKIVTQILAPSLRYLDLRYSSKKCCTFEINAPELRELLIEGRLLSCFTFASTTRLEALTLRLVEPRKELRVFNSYEAQAEAAGFDSPELAKIDRIKRHTGKLKLIVGLTYAEVAATLLGTELTWPGLEEVEIELVDRALRPLIGAIAARLAAARGASTAQCLQLSQTALPQVLQEHASDDASTFTPDGNRAMRKFLADAAAVQPVDGAQPLCSEVCWKISANKDLLATIIDWVADLANVQLKLKS